MSIDRTRRLSLDLLVADLAKRDVLVAITAAHAVAPARALIGADRPRPGEEDPLRGARLMFGALDFRPTWPFVTPPIAQVDAFLRGFVLMAELFPGAIDSHYVHDPFLDSPGSAVFERAFPLASLLWSDLEELVDGLLGAGSGVPATHALQRRYAPDGRGLAELVSIQALLRRAMGEVYDAAVVDIGLQVMPVDAAMELDEILRRDCRSRLVWLFDTELAFDVDGPDPDEAVPLSTSRGVLSAVVPETLSGLVALDFVETLRTDPQTALCALCERPMVVTPQQAARRRKGDAVYHADCHEEHRRRYLRDFQRRRRADQAAHPHTISRLAE